MLGVNNIMNDLMSLGNNPQQIEQILFSQYPNLRILSNQMKQSGLSPIQFVMQYAQQRNIPIQENQLMSMYQQMMQMTQKR